LSARGRVGRRIYARRLGTHFSWACSSRLSAAPAAAGRPRRSRRKSRRRGRAAPAPCLGEGAGREALRHRGQDADGGVGEADGADRRRAGYVRDGSRLERWSWRRRRERSRGRECAQTYFRPTAGGWADRVPTTPSGCLARGAVTRVKGARWRRRGPGTGSRRGRSWHILEMRRSDPSSWCG
jgi:hypothetical protein